MYRLHYIYTKFTLTKKRDLQTVIYTLQNKKLKEFHTNSYGAVLKYKLKQKRESEGSQTGVKHNHRLCHCLLR